MTTTETLAKRLQENHPFLFKERAERYGPILEDVLQRLEVQEKLTSNNLKKLKEKHCGSDRRPDNRKLRHLIQVLKAINAEGTFQLPIPTAPVPSVRPTLLPTSFQQWARIPTAEAQLTYLQAKENEGQGGPWDPSLNLAIRLVSHVGAGKQVVEGILMHAQARNLDPAGYLWTPVHPDAPQGAHYRLPLPGSLFPRFQAWLEDPLSASEVAGNSAEAYPQEELWAQKDLQKTRSQLEDAFKAFNANFEASQGSPDKGRRIDSWTRFAHDGRFLALRMDVPGFFLEAVRAYPLPAEVPDFEPAQANANFLNRPAPTSPHLPQPPQASSDRLPGPITLFEGEPPEDWSRQVRNALRAFTDRANELAKDGLIKKGQQSALRDFLKQQLQKADSLAPGTSILHLALLWGFSRLVPETSSKDRIKVSTLRTYFNRVFSPTLLSASETWDLTEWDDETVEEVTARILAIKNWNPATQQYFRETWANFLRFAQSFEVLTEVTIVAGQRSNLPGRARNTILKPAEIDRIFTYLYHPNLRSAHIQAGALTLGAYGGLRASEVLGLTLGDVVATEEECWVGIRAGKTPAARRRVPLHLVAPPDQTAALQEWVSKRRAEFERLRHPEQIALFGPFSQGTPFSRAALIDPLVKWLRQQAGRGIEFHLLRHTAASWLFARWYAAAIGKQGGDSSLPYGWAFGQDGLIRAHYFLQGSLTDSLDEGADAFLRLAKFLGHQGHETLIHHYLHTLGWLHGHALDRAQEGI